MNIVALFIILVVVSTMVGVFLYCIEQPMTYSDKARNLRRKIRILESEIQAKTEIEYLEKEYQRLRNEAPSNS